MKLARVLTVSLFALSVQVASCKPDPNAPPPAPAMPATWTVKADQTYKDNERQFLEAEGRLQGRLKGLRITAYDVGGKAIWLNTIVPMDTTEGDKIFRVLNHQKPGWSFLRKNDVFYEFRGPEDAEQEITAVRNSL